MNHVAEYISDRERLDGIRYGAAMELADRVRAEFGTEEIVIDSLDLVIGAHSGPGTLALFFLADHR
jgi:fatty acid-binding protein DegV